MDPKDIVVTVRLRVDQLNLIIAKLAKCPLEEVLDVFILLRQQGDACVQAAQAQAAQAQAAAMAAQRPPAAGNGVGDAASALDPPKEMPN